jgi:gamma-glutamyltranspeptidase
MSRPAIATAHFLATEAGAAVLREGGNAVDAAVCAAATISVVCPQLNGPGGDLFAQVWLPGASIPACLNASGRAGSLATIERLRSLGHTTLPERGPLTITMPGAISGWFALLDRFGTMRAPRLLEPAVKYASEGIVVTDRLRLAIQRSAELIESDDAMAAVFLPDGNVPTGFVRNPTLALSLEQIGETNGETFYRGSLARAIVDDLSTRGALLTEDDFRNHTVDWVEPLQASCFEFDLFELPPNTQGITALQLFRWADSRDLRALGHNTAAYIAVLVDLCVQAYMERDQYVSDPKFHAAPLDDMLHGDFARTNGGSGVTISSTGDTVYLCASDADGMGVSLIQSHYMGFGSFVMSPSTGIHFQNRGAYFSLDPDHVNALTPRKRTMHTLIPASAAQAGRWQLLFGSMGGDGQPQFQLQVLLNHLLWGMDIQSAITAPRFLCSTRDGRVVITVEERIEETIVGELLDSGFQVVRTESYSSLMGHAQAIRRYEDGRTYAASDPRGDGSTELV